MTRWSKRFASWGGLLLMTAGCQSMAPAEPPAAASTPVPAAANDAGGGAAPVPSDAAQQYQNALGLVRVGKTGDAERQFKQLTAAHPEFSGPYINLGLLYAEMGRLPEAEASFKAALQRNPNNAVAGNELGIVERRLGKFTEAEASYQRTIAAEPGYAPAYLNLGVLYDLYLAEPRKALDEFEHYVQLTGGNKQVAGWLVELRKRAGAPAPAAE